MSIKDYRLKNSLINVHYSYFSYKFFSHRLTQNHYSFFGQQFGLENRIINFQTYGASKDFHLIASSCLADLHAAGDTQCLPLYRYDDKGNRHDNITDWGLSQFQTHYKNKKITKEDIFYYTYAVLHNPAYRTKYELNLKREFPRLPFYENFKQWKEWGKELMDLHINYEQAKPFALKEINSNTKVEHKKTKEFFTKAEEPEPIYSFRGHAKVKLKAIKETGLIEIDEYTMLTGIPPEAWEYKLGNRSALEWVLDQYKEKKHSDTTIAAKFNTYRFADYKDHVIDLLRKVCTVSVETMKVISEMEKR